MINFFRCDRKTIALPQGGRHECDRHNGPDMTNVQDNALWFKTAKNRDISTGPLARPFVYSLAPLSHLLAPHRSIPLRLLPRPYIRSLTHFLTPDSVGK